MAVHALNNKLDLVHLLVGSDGEGGQFHVDVDSQGRLQSRNSVWDVDTLSWVAMTQPVVEADMVTVEAIYGDVTARYKISNTDTSGDPKYYGFVDADGAWYIMKETGSAYTYSRGASNYTAAWAGRAGQTYALFNITF